MEQDGLALSDAMLTAYRGDTVAARALLDRLETQRRPDWSAILMTTWFLRTRGVVRLLDGDAAGALADARESLRLDASGGNAATALWQGVQAAARLHDSDVIATMLGSTTGLRGTWVDDVRATATAIVSGLDGDGEAAAAAFAQVLAGWRERDLPLDHAFAAATALQVLPPYLLPRTDVDEALTYLRGVPADGVLRLF